MVPCATAHDFLVCQWIANGVGAETRYAVTGGNGCAPYRAVPHATVVSHLVASNVECNNVAYGRSSTAMTPLLCQTTVTQCANELQRNTVAFLPGVPTETYTYLVTDVLIRTISKHNSD